MNRQAAEHYRFLYNKMENIPEAFMNFMENLQLHSSALTKNERKAFDMILEDLKMVQTCSIQELSDRIDVTKTTIMRFCQKMGYSGYSEFKYALIQYVNTVTDHTDEEETGRIHEITGIYSDTILLLRHALQKKTLKQLAEKIRSARRVYLAGLVNSSVSARQLYYSLLMFGIEASVLESREAVKSVDLCVQKEDIMIVYSVSGNSEIIDQILELKENTGCEIVLVTSNAANTKAKHFDDTVVLPALSVPRGSLVENVPVYSVFNAILLSYISG